MFSVLPLPPCGHREVESVETPSDLKVVSAGAGQAVELGVVSAPKGGQGEGGGEGGGGQAGVLGVSPLVGLSD